MLVTTDMPEEDKHLGSNPPRQMVEVDKTEHDLDLHRGHIPKTHSRAWYAIWKNSACPTCGKPSKIVREAQ